MTVSVRLFAAARSAAGVSQTQCNPGTLAQVLEQLAIEFPAVSRVLPQCSFLVDEVSCKDTSAQLKSGAVLDVLPPFAGG
ncbi:MAG: hypothetical protein F2839_07380 [Actinobacteria bacterium]|uniref:Unannotated protein n=1 Tax=freshwater metagenome TaxID=449393 RepID=A0A6J5ZVU5_9ZZZZ|nr:hypothetical protein [Actinomycetota bacterium]